MIRAPKRPSLIRSMASISAVGLVSVAMTYASAWLCWWLTLSDQSGRYLNTTRWSAPVPKHWPQRPEVGDVFEQRLGSVVDQYATTTSATGHNGYCQLVVLSVGWPARSVFLAQYREEQDRDSSTWTRGMLRLRSGQTLPSQPHWAGFALNTAISASVITLIVLVLRWMQRRLRRRNCRCAKCGYDLTGVAVCPECGFAKPQSGETTYGSAV